VIVDAVVRVAEHERARAPARSGRPAGRRPAVCAATGRRAPRDPAIKRRWGEERIRGTLKLYLQDKSAWPSPEEFRSDGFGQLRAAITRDGGIDRWLAEFGMPAPHHLRGKRTWWTEERIEGELRRFAAGHEAFPTQREFRRAGQTALLGALRRHGGIALWATRLGLPRRERYSGRVNAAA
jgi:hypothetical protein